MCYFFSLGSYHDGYSEFSIDCPATDNYVMAPSPSFYNITNMFKFSSCSLKQFKSTLFNANNG